MTLEFLIEESVSQQGVVAVRMRERILVGGREQIEHIAAFYRMGDDGLVRSVKVYREGSADL